MNNLKEKEKQYEWTKFPPDKNSRWWQRMVDIFEEKFPKGKCKERGQAIVLLAYVEMMFQEAEILIQEANRRGKKK